MSDTPQFTQYNPNFDPNNFTYTKKRRIWPWILLTVAILFLGFIGIIIAIFAGIGSAFSGAFDKKEIKLEAQTILVMDLNGISEIGMQSPFSFINYDNASYFELTKAIENAAKDDNIKGIYYKASMVPIDPVRAEGISKALDIFKKSGKFVFAFIEVGDESQYLNALYADSIFMPQEGILELNGFSANALFFKNFMQKIGVKYEVVQFEDFKSFGEMYSRTNFSDSAKYATRVILNQRLENLVNNISERRKISKNQVLKDLNEGIFSADEALSKGYIDKIVSTSDMREMLINKAGGKKSHFMSINRYATQVPTKSSGKVDDSKTIAIINAVGPIQSGKNGSPYSGNEGIYSATFVKMLRKVREDENIKGVILRISSPGGSVIAADEIYSELQKLAKTKPIYASMADVAASGGYYIALPCDSIFAQNQTITGSIGVISVIPNFSGTIKLLGISNDTINTTKSSGQLNLFKDFNQTDIARFKNYSSKVYQRFVEKTAKNRNMSYEKARAYAKGRVWTGSDAQKRGLIDGIADLSQVIEKMKIRLGAKENMKVPIEIYPEKIDEVTSILKSFGLDYENDYDEQEKVSFKSILGISEEEFSLIKNNIPKQMQKQVYYMLDITKIAKEEKVLMALPNLLEIK